MSVIHTKQCPECGMPQTYSSKYSYLRSLERNTLCYSCRNTKRVFTDATRKKLSECQIGRIPPNKGKPMSSAQKDKMSKTRIERGLSKGRNNVMYGNTHTQQARDKISNAQLRTIEQKGLNTWLCERNQSGGFALREYKFADGRTELVQGYEPLTLSYLLSGSVDQNNIRVSAVEKPVIQYEYSGSHRYYPDCYLPDTHTIVETKSEYTWNNELGKNHAKITGSIQAGYNIRFVIWKNKKCLHSDITFTREDT